MKKDPEAFLARNSIRQASTPMHISVGRYCMEERCVCGMLYMEGQLAHSKTDFPIQAG